MKKYKVIYADPPWSYYNDTTSYPDCTTVKGMRRPPYKVMSSKDISDIPVFNISDEDCILFIWTTDYHLEKCLNVIKAWGFSYKTVGFVWMKLTSKNIPVTFMGAYTMKSGVELCLLATKGRNAHKMIKSHNIRSLVESKREEHSKKPDEIRRRIDELVGDVPKLEMFARHETNGWDVFGDEVKGSISI